MKCLPRDSRAAGERNRNAFSQRNLTRNVNCTAHKRGHRCITRREREREGGEGGRATYLFSRIASDSVDSVQMLLGGRSFRRLNVATNRIKAASR